MSSPDGIKLKNDLGLNNFKNVGVSYVYKSNPRIYIVWIDSFRPRVPMTKTYIKSFNQLTIHANTDELDYSFPIDIEQFGGNIRSAYFIVHDLAGSKLANDRMREWCRDGDEEDPIENKVFWFGDLKELTINDLRGDQNNISSFIRKWYQDNTRLTGTPTKSVKLIDLDVNIKTKKVTFKFLSEATELNGKKPAAEFKPSSKSYISSRYSYYSGDKQEVDPKKNLSKNTSKLYEIHLEIQNLWDWLDAFEGETISKKEMKEILDVADVKAWCSSPSFLFFGVQYYLTQLDSSIYPEDRQPQKWDKIAGTDIVADKHLWKTLQAIPFLLNPMASMLTKKLKDRGLI